MSLFSGPVEHAANPPESWVVAKRSDRNWVLTTKDGTILDHFATKHQAEEGRYSGFYPSLWLKEQRWYAGESIPGWKSYREVVAKG